MASAYPSIEVADLRLGVVVGAHAFAVETRIEECPLMNVKRTDATRRPRWPAARLTSADVAVR